MKTSDFDYDLPADFIAQTPVEPRDSSRLMVLDRRTGAITHRRFYEITEYLHEGDTLVLNDSRVIPARLRGRRLPGGGKAEVLLLRRLKEGAWEALLKPGKGVREGTIIQFKDSLFAEISGSGEEGMKTLKLSDERALLRLGEAPLPPYIHAALADPERYQTVYCCPEGSAAAPTAGLHFTPELLRTLKDRGVTCLFITLHIGLDTFRPVREEDPQRHIIHREYGVVSPEVAAVVNQAKAEGRRVICVGTTAVRLLEHAARADGEVEPFAGWVDLFILPGYHFRAVDALVTNFHLPRSSLIMLVSAFAGRERILEAYRTAIAQRYRFYSFGDAMLVI